MNCFSSPDEGLSRSPKPESKQRPHSWSQTALQAPDVTWVAGVFLRYDINCHVTVYNSAMFMEDGTVLQIVDSNFTGDSSRYLQLPTTHSGLQVALGTEFIDASSATQPDQEFISGDLAAPRSP